MSNENRVRYDIDTVNEKSHGPPRPGIVGMRWSMAKRLRPCMIMSTPPPLPA
ncbi:unnamed protein product [Laminaria digitata]